MRRSKSKQQAEKKARFGNAQRAVTGPAGGQRRLSRLLGAFALAVTVGVTALASSYAQDKPSPSSPSVRPEDKRKALEILDKAYTATNQVREKEGRSALLAHLAILHAKAGQVNAPLK